MYLIATRLVGDTALTVNIIVIIIIVITALAAVVPYRTINR